MNMELLTLIFILLAVLMVMVYYILLSVQDCHDAIFDIMTKQVDTAYDTRFIKRWFVDGHVNARCSIVSSAWDDCDRKIKDMGKYLGFMRILYPNNYKVYENHAGHICIEYRKEDFCYESSTEQVFEHEFNRKLKLLSIYVRQDAFVVVVLKVEW